MGNQTADTRRSPTIISTMDFSGKNVKFRQTVFSSFSSSPRPKARAGCPPKICKLFAKKRKIPGSQNTGTPFVYVFVFPVNCFEVLHCVPWGQVISCPGEPG